MRARRASLLILAALVASAAVAGAFALNGPKWGTQQVQYDINPVNADMTEADAIAAIQAGASAWSAQSRANILPYYMGRSSGSSHQPKRLERSVLPKRFSRRDVR